MPATSTTTEATASRPIVERQPSVSVSTPPATMPTVKPSDISVPLIPSARSRSGPSGNVVVSRDIPVGTMTAAPRPWSARAARKEAGSQARVASRDAAPKRVSPMRNSLRRPYRSAILPKSSRKPPDGSANAVTAHWRPVVLSPRSLPSTGSATFSTEKSRATMNWAAHSTKRTSRARPESRGGPPRGARGTAG